MIHHAMRPDLHRSPAVQRDLYCPRVGQYEGRAVGKCRCDHERGQFDELGAVFRDQREGVSRTKALQRRVPRR